MSARHAIETIGLGKDYGDVRALDALDAVVAPGAHVGVLGPNGAGKTTAMLMLATLLRPTRGVARVFGHDVVRDRAAIRRRLGLVFQEASIDGLLTVRENLRFAAGLMGLGGAESRKAIDEALSRTGLTTQASRPARQLSGGFRRLTDIARAIVHKPDLLLLDEPTTGLDPEHRDRVWALIEAERRTRGVDGGVLHALSGRGRVVRPRVHARSRPPRRRRHARRTSGDSGRTSRRDRWPGCGARGARHLGLGASPDVRFGPSVAGGSASAARTVDLPRLSAPLRA